MTLEAEAVLFGGAWPIFSIVSVGILAQIAMGRFVWGRIAIGYILGVALWGCTPPLPGPVRPDASPDGGCQVLDRITTDRMIATPDGTALVIHCDAGAP